MPKHAQAKRANALLACLLLVSISSLFQQERVLSRLLHRHASGSGVHGTIGSSTTSRRLRSTEQPPLDDAAGSAKILLREALRKRPVPDEEIDHDRERRRCSRYKWGYTPGRRRRRMFWGAAIADDSWHAIAAQALETYGIFHTVAFVESNRTQTAALRRPRYGESSGNGRTLTGTGMFGPGARVTVDRYVNEDGGALRGLEREHAQRGAILERWRRNGMTGHDVGYLSDADETFSRDFLRAAQICDVPQFASGGKDGHNRCSAPKVYGLVAVFEGSPGCVSAEEIYHPAMLIGDCIEGIGDSGLHPQPSRHRDIATNWRNDNYTFRTYFSALHDPRAPPPPKTLPPDAYFPLWNAADYRRNPGGFFYGDDYLPLYVGYHIHNFFDDISVMRNKYLTYGHAISDALTRPLGDMNRELNLMVRCATNNRTLEVEGSVMKRFKSKDERRRGLIAMRKGGLDFLRRANYGNETGGAVPLAFRLEEYVLARHQEMAMSIRRDERKRLLAVTRETQG